MSELQNKLYEIKEQKDTYIIPENIKENVTVLGITGTLKEGTDTTDADATLNDIVENKTAYVKGSKVTGNIKSLGTTALNTNDCTASNQELTLTKKDSSYNRYIPKNTNYKLKTPYWAVRGAIGLYDSNLIADGETILGITGTYKGPAERSIYEFNSTSNMETYLSNLQSQNKDLDVGTKADVIEDNSPDLTMDKIVKNTQIVLNNYITVTNEEEYNIGYLDFKANVCTSDGSQVYQEVYIELYWDYDKLVIRYAGGTDFVYSFDNSTNTPIYI